MEKGINKKRIGEQGSVTLFVLVAMLFLLIVLVLAFSSQANKINNNKKEIMEIQRQYNVDHEIDQKYYDSDQNNMISKIVLYKPSGEIYNINEWTNQDLTLKIFYPEGLNDDYKFYYLDGIRKQYTEGQKITRNCEIKVEYDDYKTELVVSRIDKQVPTIINYAGAMLYEDPSFANGVNSISVYNNMGNGMVTHTRKEMSDNPTGSGYGIEIKTTGIASPGQGGFYFANATAANKEFITRIVAKIPIGYTLRWVSNGYGTTGTEVHWLTEEKGTGEWQEYVFRVKCGLDGTFEDTNYFYLEGGGTATTSSPVTWQLGYATVIDTTKWAKMNYVITVGVDNESGVVGYGQSQTNTVEPNYTNNNAKRYIVKMSETLTTNGTYYSWIKDQVGNVTYKPVDIQYIDNVAPSVPNVIYNGGANTCAWKNNYNITLNSTDYASGVAYYEIDWDLNGTVDQVVGSNFIPVNGYNTCSCRFRAVDNVENRSEWTDSHHIHMDTQAPGVPTVTYNVGNNTCAWQKEYNLTLSASDNIGVAYYEIDWEANGIVNATTESNFIPWKGYSSCNNRFRAVDYAGNRSEWTSYYHIHKNVNYYSLRAGDYVYYIDSNNITRRAIVLYDSTFAYGVQIITEDIVENIQLGNGYGSSVNDTNYYNTARNSYNNAIATLNGRANAYLNTTYANSARSVGSVPNNPSSEAGYVTINSSYLTSSNNTLKSTDQNYVADNNQMQLLGIKNIGKDYWLASRDYYTLNDHEFRVRSANANGSTLIILPKKPTTLYNKQSYSCTTGFRPVFSLKPEIVATGGSGTSEDPYVLGI